VSFILAHLTAAVLAFFLAKAMLWCVRRTMS
jgi:hypothetical protein